MPIRHRITGYVVDAKPVVVRTKGNIRHHMENDTISRELFTSDLDHVYFTIDKKYADQYQTILDVICAKRGIELLTLFPPVKKIEDRPSAGHMRCISIGAYTAQLLQEALIQLEDDLSFSVSTY
jgi:hypothetical protein